jgi:hypothetical protein
MGNVTPPGDCRGLQNSAKKTGPDYNFQPGAELLFTIQTF